MGLSGGSWVMKIGTLMCNVSLLKLADMSTHLLKVSSVAKSLLIEILER